jgi:hypothetical protein
MQNAETMRERLFTMRMSGEEAERLDLVAAHYGLNAASLIRMLLKREETALKVPPNFGAVHAAYHAGQPIPEPRIPQPKRAKKARGKETGR